MCGGLAVSCHLHFWQNDQDLLRATAVTRGSNEYRNKPESAQKKLTLEKKILRQLMQGLEPGTFDLKSGALTTELPPFPVSWCENVGRVFLVSALP